MRARSVVAGVLLFVATLGDATRAGAEESPSPSPSRARADALFRAGLAQSSAGDPDAACASFAAAYALVPSVDILWNLAASERRAGRVVDALEHLRRYVGDAAARPSRKTLATEWIAALEDETGIIVIDAPDGAAVDVDGTASDREVRVAGGVHIVNARLGGRAVANVVEVRARGTVVATMRFDERSVAEPAATTAPPTPAL